MTMVAGLGQAQPAPVLAGGQGAPPAQAVPYQDQIAAIQAAVTPVVQAAVDPIFQAVQAPALQHAVRPVMQAVVHAAEPVLDAKELEDLKFMYPSKTLLKVQKYGCAFFSGLLALLGLGGAAGGIALGILGRNLACQVSWLAPSALMLVGAGAILLSTLPLWLLAAKKCYKIWQNRSIDCRIIADVASVKSILTRHKADPVKQPQLQQILDKVQTDIKAAYFNSGNWRAKAAQIASKAAQLASKAAKPANN